MSDSVQPHRRQPARLRHPWDSPGKNTGVGCHFLLQCMKVKGESEVVQSCPTLSDPMDCSLPGSSVHGIFQARALEWGAVAIAWVQSLVGELKSCKPCSAIKSITTEKLQESEDQLASQKKTVFNIICKALWLYSCLVKWG